MATEYNILRSKMVDYIKRSKEGQFDLHGRIKTYFQGHDIELDENDLRTVEQIIHEFYLEDAANQNPLLLQPCLLHETSQQEGHIDAQNSE